MTWSYIGFWGGGGLAGLVSAVFVLRARRVLTPAAFGALLIAWCGFAIGARWQARLESLPVLNALWIPGEFFEPGMRMPLGLVTGAALAGLWCMLFGAPWREVGDALAVAASVLIPIGRMGCIANGCCMGGVCRRVTLFCMRVPPDSEAYGAQLQQNLISPDAPLSLPAHPLPIYFAVASLLTLAVLLWLLRRGAPAGAMLATFGILWPLGKLLLEPLRAISRPGVLMLGIPATMLIGTCTVLAVMLVRRNVARTQNQARLGPREATSI